MTCEPCAHGDHDRGYPRFTRDGLCDCPCGHSTSAGAIYELLSERERKWQRDRTLIILAAIFFFLALAAWMLSPAAR